MTDFSIVNCKIWHKQEMQLSLLATKDLLIFLLTIFGNDLGKMEVLWVDGV